MRTVAILALAFFGVWAVIVGFGLLTVALQDLVLGLAVGLTVGIWIGRQLKR